MSDKGKDRDTNEENKDANCEQIESIDIDSLFDDNADFEELLELLEENESIEDIDFSNEKEEINALKQKLHQKEQNSYIEFDKEFKNFLKNFVSQQEKKDEQKLILKAWFFILIMLGFFSLLITPLMIIWLYRNNTAATVTVVVSLITTLIELVSAIVVLPKIIAEYLFNKEEDKNMMQIISSMQNYNEKKHDHIERYQKNKR